MTDTIADYNFPTDENPFKSLEDFSGYMKSFKKAVKMDDKLNLVMTMMIQNICNTIFDSIEMLVKGGNMDKKYALIMIHSFAETQKHRGSMGQIFGMDINLTEVAKCCGIIPDSGVEIMYGTSDHPEGEGGMCIGVTEDAPEEVVAEIMELFAEDENFKFAKVPTSGAEA